MKFRKCAAAGVLALCLAAAGPLSALAGQNAGPGAAYQPSVNGVNIYVSKMGNTLTLKQYAQTIGTWPVSWDAVRDRGQGAGRGDEITPSGSFYVCTRNDQSICYLALGLSYPNAEDAERG